jgi:predicted lactoylglutathione lyase
MEGMMADLTGRKLFVNVAVPELAKSKAFFAALGFAFQPQVHRRQRRVHDVSDDVFVMLLAEPFFKLHQARDLRHGAVHESLLALSCASRAEVDDMVRHAVAAGGRHAMEPQDHGFMCGWSFYDLDGHHWEPFWMNDKAVQ